MTNDSDLLVKSYVSWLRRGVKADSLDEGLTELTTPFLDRHNDHLQIVVERQGIDVFALSDDGYIVSELKASGVDTRGSRREQILRELLVGHGVTLEKGELTVAATSATLGQRVHNLIQAMLAVDDMFVLAQPRTESLFLEDVTKFLDQHDVRYAARVKFSGRSGLDHLVDFVIPHSKTAPERVLQIVNSPRRDRVESMLFAVNDTKSARGTEVAYYALINDGRRKIDQEMLGAYEAYGVVATPWSRREQIAERLAA